MAVIYSFQSVTSTLTGNTLTARTAGNCTVASPTPRTSNHNPAAQVTASVTVTTTKSDQTITFPAIAPFSWNGGSATLSATASSGLAVTYSVQSGPCSVSGSTLTATAAGSCTIAADQAGDST